MAKVKLTVSVRYFWVSVSFSPVLTYFGCCCCQWCCRCCRCYSCFLAFAFSLVFPVFSTESAFLAFYCSPSLAIQSVSKQQWIPFHFVTFNSILFFSHWTFWRFTISILHYLLFAAIKFWNILRCYFVACWCFFYFPFFSFLFVLSLSISLFLSHSLVLNFLSSILWLYCHLVFYLL